MPDLLLWAADHWGLLVAAAGVLAVAVRATPRLRRWARQLDDLFGEEARPGVPARPGVMERLALHDDALRELLPNGGSSIKDTVDRIDARTEQLAQRVEAVERVVVPDRPTLRRPNESEGS